MPPPLIALLALASAPSPDAVTTSTASTATVTAAPGQETTYRVEPESRDTAGRKILRATLFLPRWTLRVALAPIEGLLWLTERYNLPGLFQDVFFNDARTVGAYPSLFVETGFGASIGAHLVIRDVFGKDAAFSLDSGFAGRTNAQVEGRLHSGRWLGDHFRLEIRGLYEDQPREFFFGIGPNPPEDEMRLQRTRREGALYAHITPTDRIRFRLGGTYGDIRIGQSESDPDAMLDDFRPKTTLAVQSLLAELDGRRSPDELVPDSTPSTGGYLGVLGSVTEVFSDPKVTFGRVAADARYLFDLGLGTRVLMLRAYTESLIGAGSGEAPTVELPRLGGPQVLRGYLRDRFRDTTSVLASVEYRYPIISVLRGYLFVDAGRVADGYDELSFENTRVGFGGGLEILSASRRIGRVQLASSIDGGLVFNLQLSPDFDLDRRQDR